MRNTKSRMDITFDSNAPSIVVRKPQYREGYIGILKRGGSIRCITEVTSDNIGYCKELLQLVTELRHMDGMKGGIAINESEYMATTVLKEAKPLTEVIYSNADEVVTQGQYIFDTIWKNDIPAIRKIREIEEGYSTEYTTKILSRSEGTLNEANLGESLYKAKEIDMVSSTEGLSMGYDFFKILGNPTNNGQKFSSNKCMMRLLVEVSKDNIDLVKKYIDMGIEVRHLKKEPSIYFAVTNNNMMATIERMAFEDLAESLLYSNDPNYVRRFKLIFERMWNDSKPAEEIIEILKKDEEIPFIETIEYSDKTISLIKGLITNSRSEILGIIPSFEAFQRHVDIGMFDHLMKTLEAKQVSVKILVTDKIESLDGNSFITIGKGKYRLSLKMDDVEAMNVSSNSSASSSKTKEFTVEGKETMRIRSVFHENIRPEMGMVIVDKRKSLIIESKESQSDSALDRIGMASYSNSSQISRSYATMFESLWNYSKTFNMIEKSFERLKVHDKMQREFIDIVVHELRTPLQSILGMTEILKARTKEKETRDMIVTVNENGARLHRFVENVLTATKLEGYISKIPRETFDLSSLIIEIVDTYKERIQNMKRSNMPNSKDISFEYKGMIGHTR
jgi:two-component system, OmpR family, sensor histidine kinase VicK